MKVMLLSVVTLFVVITDSFAQTFTDGKGKKNELEIYVPICHFFDDTRTNWTLLVPGQKRVYGPGRVHLYNKEVMRVPAIAGIQYSRRISFNNSIRFSFLAFYLNYLSDSLIPGEVIQRSYSLLSLGFVHQVMGNDKVHIDAIGEVNYRRGTEIVHIYFPYPWDNRVEGLLLRDLGLSVGARIERALPLNILVSGEVKCTRFLYRYSDGVDFFGKHKDSTPNTLTIKFGLGYKF